ncbi:MAG: ABC transporter permease [Clostridia bacterium]|nr:ABC transporter permease [Clostridia bacterium]
MVVLETLLSGTNQGLLWAIMAIGVYISYRILDFADLTVEGSFATGGATAAIMMTLCKDFVTKGPGQGMLIAIIAMLLATIVGGLAGLVTGLLNTKLKIAPILAGILTMTGLYSINMLIMGIGSGSAKSNLGLGSVGTLFTKIEEFMPIGRNWVIFIVGFLAVAIVIGIIYWFFGTETGSAMRATGNNEKMAKAQGINTQSSKILGLVLSNAFVALSGAMIAFQQNNATNTMGVGSIVAGLAAIIIGEGIISGKFPFWARLISVALGSVIYRIIISFIYLVGINAEYVKLLTAILVVVALSIPLIKDKINKVSHKSKKGDGNTPTGDGGAAKEEKIATDSDVSQELSEATATQDKQAEQAVSGEDASLVGEV